MSEVPLRSSTSRWLTRRPTARSSVPMAWSLMVWQIDSTTRTRKKGGKWIHKLSSVFWGLRTQPSKAACQSLFFLVYGLEAILPADIMWQSPRLEMYEEGEANQARHLELDSVEGIRCNVLLQSARYLQGIQRYHDRNVQQTTFSIGDLVLHRIQEETGLHKLNSRWEGALHRQQDHRTRVVPTIRLWWLGGSKFLEHLESAPILSLNNLYPKFSTAAQHYLSIKSWFDLQMTTFALTQHRRTRGIRPGVPTIR
jgi:hypothetical protein